MLIALVRLPVLVGMLSLALVTGIAEPARAEGDCTFCTEVAIQLGDPPDQAEAIRLCHVLSGALRRLGDDRAAFLAGPRYIDLFPLVYWHVTSIELQRLHNRDFAHPIEKMQQMLLYVDAYQRNRERWFRAGGGEAHWRRHFAAAADADRIGQGVAGQRVLETPALLETVLALANSAHVEFDFPRAIRDSFAHRRHPQLSAADLYPDFVETNATLRAATSASAAEIFGSIGQNAVWRPVLVSSAAVGWWTRTVERLSDWVIERRAVAWTIAFGGGALPTGEEPSPRGDHDAMAEAGSEYCAGGFRDPR